MRRLWYRALILWYRLLGATPAQAEWRARRALQAPAKARSAAQAHVQRAADERFTCACGQLLVKGDGTCHACGRRQYLPFWLRRLGRTIGLADNSTKVPGTVFVAITMVLGYLIQIRYGAGSFSNPSPGFEALELGAAFGDLVMGPQPWRAITYTTVHGGLMHLGFNAFALSQIGPLIERRFGSSRFLLGWSLGAAGGAVAAAVFAPPGFIVGASGAVFGLIGMAMLQGHREGTTGGRFLRNEMIKWTVFTTVFGLMMGGISHAGHFGGLAVGAGLTLALPPADGRPGRRRLTPAIGALAIALLLGSFVGFGHWFVTRTVPESAPAQVQLLLYEATRTSQGDGKVFGPEGRELLRRIRAEDRMGPEALQAYRGEAVRLSADWPASRRQFFYFHVEEALGGLPPVAPPRAAPPSIDSRARELQQPPR